MGGEKERVRCGEESWGEWEPDMLIAIIFESFVLAQEKHYDCLQCCEIGIASGLHSLVVQRCLGEGNQVRHWLPFHCVPTVAESLI